MGKHLTLQNKTPHIVSMSHEHDFILGLIFLENLREFTTNNNNKHIYKSPLMLVAQAKKSKTMNPS